MLSESLSVIVFLKYTPVADGSMTVKCNPSFRRCSPQDNNTSERLTPKKRVRTVGIGNIFRYKKHILFLFSHQIHHTVWRDPHLDRTPQRHTVRLQRGIV